MGKKKKISSKKPSYAERLQQQREKIAKEKTIDSDVSVPSIDSNYENTQQLAKEMIEAQRSSVDMLTFVKKRIDDLPFDEIMDSLDNDGYAIVDNFLSRDDTITSIQCEGIALFEKGLMETDLSRLGSGEYLKAVEGGETQYKICPRSIEMVVSMTKNFPSHFKLYNLDNSNCIANMRTFDGSSKQASLALVGVEELPSTSFDIISSGDNDMRRISLFYYPVSNEIISGGFVVEKDAQTISAKRDRLIILLSDSCRHRTEYFENDDNNKYISRLELHLVRQEFKK